MTDKSVSQSRNHGGKMQTSSEFHAYVVELLTDEFNGHMEHGSARPVARECADKILETLLSNPQMTRWIADGAGQR